MLIRLIINEIGRDFSSFILHVTQEDAGYMLPLFTMLTKERSDSLDNQEDYVFPSQ